MTSEKPVSLEAYNIMAEDYFTAIDTKSYNAYYERPGTLSLLPDVAGKRVLDAGCAAGWYTKWLLDRGAEVTALDFSPNMIEMTKRRVGDRAEVRQADLNEPLDFIPEHSLDVVLSSLVLHYLKDWTGILSEFYRILRPGGTLVFSVHHPFMDFTQFERENYFATELLEDTWSSHAGPVTVHFYRRPLSQIITRVLQAGFSLEELAEPMPIEYCREVAPRVYERLSQRPQFLFIRAQKKEQPQSR